jgi:hypothetical protein
MSGLQGSPKGLPGRGRATDSLPGLPGEAAQRIPCTVYPAEAARSAFARFTRPKPRNDSLHGLPGRSRAKRGEGWSSIKLALICSNPNNHQLYQLREPRSFSPSSVSVAVR